MKQPIIEITSVQNLLLRDWARVAKRGCLEDGTPVLPVEGPKLVAEAIRGGWIPRLAAAAREAPGRESSGREAPGREISAHKALSLHGLETAQKAILENHLLAKLADTESPQSPIVFFEAPPGISSRPAKDSFPAAKLPPADDSPLRDDSLPPEDSLSSEDSPSPAIAPSPKKPSASDAPRIVIADGIQDPGNLGALVRSAWAFGFSDFAAVEGGARLLTPKTLRASAGALFHIRLRESRSAESWRDFLLGHGYSVIVLEAGGAVALEEVPWKEPFAVVVGNEAHGPSPAWYVSTKGKIITARIPIQQACESLNAAMAGAVAFYAAATKCPARPSHHPKPLL